MEPLTPTLDDLKQIAQDVGPGPVVLLNLLKFLPEGGREVFHQYGALVTPLLERVGGKILYIGEGGPVVAGGGDWDLVVLVRFESIDHFVQLPGDPLYQTEARALREHALERTLWMVTTPSPAL